METEVVVGEHHILIVNRYGKDSRTPKAKDVKKLKRFCRRGHDLADPNNVYDYDGTRKCKPCSLLRAAKYRRRSELKFAFDDGYCKRGHKMNPDGSCGQCQTLLYDAKMKRLMRSDGKGSALKMIRGD